jgi:thiamine biosynthesis protein ThiS
VHVNDEPLEIEDRVSVVALLKRLGCEEGFVAIAIDGTFLPRHNWSDYILQEGQSLDVVSPMQGG